MTENEFKARLRPEGDCLIWTGAKTENGYGRLRIGPKYERAHRHAYRLFKGDIPEGALILHSCDVRLCCNPEHLRAGNHKENMAEMVVRGRAAKGAGGGNAKLNVEQIKEIRSRYRKRSREDGGLALARQYGVQPSTVSYVVNRKRWSHLA